MKKYFIVYETRKLLSCIQNILFEKTEYISLAENQNKVE